MGNCYGAPVENHALTPLQTPDTTPVRDIRQYKVGTDSSSVTKKTGQGSGNSKSQSLIKFSAEELRVATNDFRPDRVLGEGGFGIVYEGWIDEKTFKPSKVGFGRPVAVKRSHPTADQGYKEWKCEVKFLGKYSHPNLVQLIGSCMDGRDLYLVYECMQKGSLEDHLFKKGSALLSWTLRMKIMVGAARGLAFLHSSEKSVIYRDFKTSNILLDVAYNAKLSDFGMARLGPNPDNTHVTTRVMGTYGYAAPEYVATGHLYVKSDVYCFGVVLLEMLTGMRAFDTNRPSGSYNLVEWAMKSLSSKKKLKKIMDPRLEDQYPMKGACLAAELVSKCLQPDQKTRPSMDQVLKTLEFINSSY